ncbi:hypothetical protein BGW80DRAFT_1460521 [Lactifluus volemus]|nr:hypothetical protein BGW80DRAFT_1460521 [Lactifluus volemus]
MSSLDATRLLRAPDNDPVVEPSGIDRLFKRVDIVMPNSTYTAPSSDMANTRDIARYLLDIPTTQVSRLRRTSAGRTHAACGGTIYRPRPSSAGANYKMDSVSGGEHALRKEEKSMRT